MTATRTCTCGADGLPPGPHEADCALRRVDWRPPAQPAPCPPRCDSPWCNHPAGQPTRRPTRAGAA